MTLEEYQKTLQALDCAFEEVKSKYQADVLALNKEYALNNSPLKKGDIAEDEAGLRVRVDRIGFYMKCPPCCIYSGPVLKRDGNPRKSGEERSIYQMNLKK